MKNKMHAVLVLVAATAATFLLLSSNVRSQSNASPQLKLGGAFIGSAPGMVWNALHIPLDPAGRTAALRIHTLSYAPEVAGLLAAFGADAMTEGTGQSEMTGRDTAKYRSVFYAVKQGNPPVIQGILVQTGTLQFTGPDAFVVNYTTDMYLPAADADGDGLPDQGTTPLFSVPGSSTAKRITAP